MKFIWCLAFLFALILSVYSVALEEGKQCRDGYTLDDVTKFCVADRDAEGNCPRGSLFEEKIGKCIFVLRS